MRENSKLRVMHVIPSLSMGGAERLTLDICSSLAKRPDVEVCLVVLHDQILFQLPEHFSTYQTTSRMKLSVLKKNKKDLADFKSIVSEFKPDVIHSHLFEAEILSRGFINESILYVTHVHDNMDQLKKLPLKKFPTKEELTNYYERGWLLKKYKRINNQFITISSDTDRFIEKHLPRSLSKHRIQLLNAIDCTKFHPKSITTAEFQQIKLVSIGSFVAKKNQLFLLDVVFILLNKKIDVHLTLVGDGDLRTAIEQRISELGIENHVTLTGNIENVAEKLMVSNIYVHAATYEPFGLVILEAMASGLPVVCIDGKGNRDLMEHGRNGFLMDGLDPIEMVEYILKLQDNRSLYDLLSRNAILFASQFDISNYTNRLVAFYQLNKELKN
jgi:glycosyltransferase involved in cell wall biosynthesis